MKSVVYGLAVWLLTATAMASSPMNDPTRPAGWQRAERVAVKLPALSVTSIVYSDSHRFAMVNGRSVSEGDRVSGARVTRIRPGRVEFVYRGIRFWRRGTTVAEVKKRVRQE